MPLWTISRLAVPARCWWDASDATTLTLDSGVVSSIADKSPFGNHLSSTGTERPAYEATGFNGMPTMSFDGVNDFLRRDSGGPSSQGPIFYAAVFQFSASRQWQPVIHHTDNSTSQQGGLFLQQRNTTTQIGPHNSGRVDTGVFVDVNPNLLSARFATMGRSGGTATGQNGTITVTADNLINTGTQTWETSIATTRIVLGGRQQSGTQFFFGKISEAIGLDYSPSTDERQRIEGYFAHKWDLTGSLAVDHPYKTMAPLFGLPRRSRSQQTHGAL